MPWNVWVAAAIAVLILFTGSSAEAQTFEGPGTRAQGMGGAFVALADDASAVYWNPAGLASGAYFSLLLDRTEADAFPSGEARGGERSSWLLALATPPLGLSYYRLQSAAFAPAGPQAPDRSRVESLVTHHAGATIVQTIAGSFAVGATVKLVRGLANAGVGAGDGRALLEALPMGRATTRFDIDAGAIVSFGQARAGVTFRNLTRPEFDTPLDEPLHLDRQARLGASFLLIPGWTAAVDFDLTVNHGPFGDVRTLAFGAEGQLTRRATVRAGLNLNTAGDIRAPTGSAGASYVVSGSVFVDAHVSAGSEHGFGGWGVAGRVIF
jgi:hypothetical protein